MLHCEARRDARRDAGGAYVPLSKQDTSRWSLPMIEEAECFLRQASSAGRVGRFQLEAAIQPAHAHSAPTGVTDWETISVPFEGLVTLAPTIGARVGHAASVAEARGPEAGWRLLRNVAQADVVSYQPYWALAAHLLKALGRGAEAAQAYELAIGLCEDPATRDLLRRQSR